jgi:hypothetical protein
VRQDFAVDESAYDGEHLALVVGQSVGVCESPH